MQSLMKVQLWNIDTFEHLNRTLNRWLDAEITEGEKTKKIQRLNITLNQNGEVRFWMNVKTDRDVHMMMYTSHKIVLMVVIA